MSTNNQAAGLRERYDARCSEIFADITTGQERPHPDTQACISVHDYADCYKKTKYDKYDLSDVDASGSNLTSPD